MLLKNKVERRSYKQFCGLARALDAVGERWTLLIVRNLLAGPQRYGELSVSLPGITTNLLAKRLREMVAAGIVDHRQKRYALTAMGRELEPAVMALGRWGGRYLKAGPRSDDVVNIRWGMVSLKRRYRGTHTGAITMVVEERCFTFEFGPSRIDVVEDTGQPDAPPQAALVVRGSLPAFQQWLFRGAPAKCLTVDGPGFSDFCESFGLRT
ncbi:MAG: winged helix-turn-helix transcriptional regulator [Nannocystaceae bacterium]